MPKPPNQWKLNYQCDPETRKQNNARVYFIVVDDEIYKIGSSASKGGIKNTFQSYEYGRGGAPSLRTFGITCLIQEQLDLGKQISIFAIFSEPIRVQIQGLITRLEKDTYPQIKEMEDLCRENYKSQYGKYPRWNFQENVEQYPPHIEEKYREWMNTRGITRENKRETKTSSFMKEDTI